MTYSEDFDHEMGTRHLERRGSARPLVQHGTQTLDARPPSTVRFILADYSAAFDVRLQSNLMIGRKSAHSSSPQQVDVDLTPFGADRAGVSRYHAIIHATSTRLFVKDFNSTNGTMLNGGMLEPMREYRLRHGDQLTVGRLSLIIHFMDE